MPLGVEVEELEKRYQDEKKGKGNSIKGRKKATKKETAIVVEEPALLHQTLPTKKKASPTLVKKTSVITDRKKTRNQTSLLNLTRTMKRYVQTKKVLHYVENNLLIAMMK